ncbi:hypothetical protein LCGC14_2114730 [marine sediment metagenome]|uniref:Uncharacterized protein n=1 Tax=marine sediment metagenome TaxID=412755 RepID=A0A0F9H2C2_9ZZZZ
MGGGPKLFETPAPAPISPEVTTEYKDLISGQGLETIGKTLKPQEATQLDYKGGDPTELGYSVDFDAKRMADVLEAGRRRQTERGRTNVLGAFAGMGLRASSSAVQGMVDYEAQVARDYLSQLQQLELGLVPHRLAEAGARAGLEEAEKGRGFQALLTQADLTEAGRARDVHLGYTWLAALADMGMSYYSTKALVNTPSILQQIMGGAQAAADIASVYVAGKP